MEGHPSVAVANRNGPAITGRAQLPVGCRGPRQCHRLGARSEDLGDELSIDASRARVVRRAGKVAARQGLGEGRSRGGGRAVRDPAGGEPLGVRSGQEEPGCADCKAGGHSGCLPSRSEWFQQEVDDYRHEHRYGQGHGGRQPQQEEGARDHGGVGEVSHRIEPRRRVPVSPNLLVEGKSEIHAWRTARRSSAMWSSTTASHSRISKPLHPGYDAITPRGVAQPG